MFDICLFDLDETLLRTDDVKELREAGKNDKSVRYKELVENALDQRDDRHIYRKSLLERIRKRFPEMKLGVFTRSPRSYALTTLEWAYPGFVWDVVVAYEDVAKRKPSGEGIDHAMDAFGKLDADFLPRTVLVGDNDVDVKAAYNCGCVVVLDKGAWPERKWTFDHWGALGHVPDAIIEKPEQMLDFLINPTEFLPALERALIAGFEFARPPRFDRIGHFVPKQLGGTNAPIQISVCGRSFANYESLEFRKDWHSLTKSIDKNKDSDVFPEAWVETVRHFIISSFTPFMSPKIIVSVVPHRPGRKPRLEKFLSQVSESIKDIPLTGLKVSFEPDLLAYRDGVRSHHNEHLSALDRFSNVKEFLFVNQPELVRQNTAFIIIDDVVTTGASLIYSKIRLSEEGAQDVRLLSLAKNVGEILK